MEKHVDLTKSAFGQKGVECMVFVHSEVTLRIRVSLRVRGSGQTVHSEIDACTAGAED